MRIIILPIISAHSQAEQSLLYKVLFLCKITIFAESCAEAYGGHIGESVFALSF